MAGIWFNYLTSAGRFYVSAFFNLAGLVLTILFVRPTPLNSPTPLNCGIKAVFTLEVVF